MSSARVEGPIAVLRRVGPLAVAGAVANAANIVVTIVIARLLSTRAYGSLAQLIGLFLVLSMPGSALLVAVVRRVAAWELAGDRAAAEAWVTRIRRIAALGLAAWAVVAVALRGVGADALSLPGPAGVAEVLIGGGAWALLSIERGLLQARQAYGALARNLLVEGVVRTGGTLGLVAAGLGVEGAALAIVAAIAVALGDARLSLHRTTRRRAVPDPPALPEEPSAPPVLPTDDDLVEANGVPGLPGAGTGPGHRHLAVDLGVALAALALVAVLQSLDVVILGREAPENAGAYAAISVTSKVLVFGATVLAGYLLPEAVRRWHLGQHALRPLAAALGLIGLPAAVLLAVALVAPEPALRLVFGPTLAAASAAFAPLALAMACLAASVLFTNYLLGIGRPVVVAVLLVAALVTGGTVAAAGGAPVGTARAELACQAVLALTLGWLAVTAHRRRAPVDYRSRAVPAVAGHVSRRGAGPGE